MEEDIDMEEVKVIVNSKEVCIVMDEVVNVKVDLASVSVMVKI